ncbi:MAG: peptidoglycan-binding protein [Geminicoccaceae bacterium]
MRAVQNPLTLVLPLVVAVGLTSCQQVESLTADLKSTVSTERDSGTPSCDPSFSLAGYFDSRPEILIDKPAKNPQAGELRRVAVIPPKGDGSDEFTRRFEAALTSLKVDGQPYFQVVTRTDLDKVMAAQGFSRSGVVAPGSAAKVGRILGVDGIYIPQILEYEISDSKYQGTGPEGGQCTKRTVSFRAIPKLVDVSTGQVVYAEEHGDNREERYCPNGGGAVDGGISAIKSFVGKGGLTEGRVVMGQLLDTRMTNFMADIAPQSCMKKMNIMDETEGLSDDLITEKFEAAVAFMKSGRYDRACPAWRSLESSGETAVSLYNNLAICAEIEDKLIVAKSYCAKADSLLTWPSDDINLCIENVDKRLAEASAMRVAGCGPLTDRRKIREVQQILADLGYLKGSADGLIGPGTIAAIIDFQSDSGLPAEGKVDACLLDDLRSL